MTDLTDLAAVEQNISLLIGRGRFAEAQQQLTAYATALAGGASSAATIERGRDFLKSSLLLTRARREHIRHQLNDLGRSQAYGGWSPRPYTIDMSV
jgi:hypothetical protein